MKNPEKQWIKKVDAAIILVMRRCLRNYLLIFFGLRDDSKFGINEIDYPTYLENGTKVSTLAFIIF